MLVFASDHVATACVLCRKLMVLRVKQCLKKYLGNPTLHMEKVDLVRVAGGVSMSWACLGFINNKNKNHI